MLLAIARLELRFHAREFLTYIYLLVFFLLTFAFASGGGVELVSGRGPVPRGAAWTLGHAMAGLTAFGQVMTAFIAATAMLRDTTTRMEPLLFTTAITRRAYVGGKLLGAMVTMLLVYLGIPAGLMLGALMPWAPPDAAPVSAAAYVVPLLVLVLPNIVMVTAAFFAAGTLSRTFTAVAVTGLGLVAAWQAGLWLVTDEQTRLLGALVDPFGNAAIAASAAGWSDIERATSPLPLATYLIPNRVVWSMVALALLAAVFARYRLQPAPTVSRVARRTAGVQAIARTPTPRAPREAAPVRAPRATDWSGAAAAYARLTTRTLATEKGFVAIALLGVLNATLNAATGGGSDPRTIADTLVVHTRIFFILLATIYAGELVWRERDVRMRPLVDSGPTDASAEVAGKAAALIALGAIIGAVLGVVAISVLLLRGGETSVIPGLLTAAALLPAAMLVALALLSLAVHALIFNKVRAHFALIAAWVAGVALAEGGTTSELGALSALGALVRPDADGGVLRLAALLCLAGAGAAVAAGFWPRGAVVGLRARVAALDARGLVRWLVAAAVLLGAALLLAPGAERL